MNGDAPSAARVRFTRKDATDPGADHLLKHDQGIHESDLELDNRLSAGDISYDRFNSFEKKYSNQKDTHAFLKYEFCGDCFLSDGKRQIDYVLAYEDENVTVDSDSSLDTVNDWEAKPEEDDIDSDPPAKDGPHDAEPLSDKKARRRAMFERNLQRMGLVLERVEVPPALGRTRFVLIHAPFDLLEKQAQLMVVKLPVTKSDVYFQNRTYLPGFVDRLLNRSGMFDFDPEIAKVLDQPDYFTAPYSSDRRQQFVNWDREDLLFPAAERSRMVYDLLTRTMYDDPIRGADGERPRHRFGIERLLSSYTYTAAYPVHQELRSRKERREAGKHGEVSQRELLVNHWSSFRNVFKYQPLDCIKRYFGAKVAFYFAWLGYYTKCLYLAAFLGILCVLYGVMTISQDTVSNDICGSDGIGRSTVLCPQCENYCDYQKLNGSCVYAKMTYLFDNISTVIFAALMCVWASLFLEGWKRYHAEISWKWGLLDFIVEEDSVRPDFQFRVRTTRYNPVTNGREPYLSGQKKFANFVASLATILFFIFLILAVLLGMYFYRVIVMQLLAKMDHPAVDSLAFLIVAITSAMINLVVILIMNLFYNELALRLTRWECPRTQAEFDNSYTFKVFWFQFANYYSSIFYVAFFKGVLSQLPGKRDSDGNMKIGGYRLEGCDAAGCFVELVIQLATIMCGKQFFSAIVEWAYPIVMSLLRQWQYIVPVLETKAQRKRRILEEKEKKSGSRMKRWEADYYLNPTYDQFLFDEYLEMVLQFGFVTLFVSAFPLAPVFALLNNILEIRLDASKFLISTQRPNPAMAKNIGNWLTILEIISKASVTINALVIAFTSDFVPKTLYRIMNGNMFGYVDSSLSYFDAALFVGMKTTFAKTNNVTVNFCRFRGYRKFPCSLSPYVNVTQSTLETCVAGNEHQGVSFEWWQILAARLIFVFIFEHFVFIIQLLLEYLIPDVPERIFVQQQREKFLLRKALVEDYTSNDPRQKSEREHLRGGGEGRSGGGVGGWDTSGALMDDVCRSRADNERNAFQPGAFTHAKYDTGELFHGESVESFATAASSTGPRTGSAPELRDVGVA